MSDLIDPVQTALIGRADLIAEFWEPYARREQVRTRIFKRGDRTLIAFTGERGGERCVSRYIDLLAPALLKRFGLDPAKTFWLDHDSRTGCLAIFEADWIGPDMIQKPRWTTLVNGGYHHYAGKDYVRDINEWLDSSGLIEGDV